MGTIAEVKGVKARVRLGPTLTTEWLRWATGSTRTWSAPTVGEQVIVFATGCGLSRGLILPVLYSQEFDVAESSDSIHTTHYPDGAVVQYGHAAHALTATLPGSTATSLGLGSMWERAKECVGMKDDVVFRDIRALAAKDAARHGENRSDIQKRRVHTSGKTTESTSRK
ncbi:phage baseplate assembly protein V [Janthinobacterium sp. TB1-E2]|uniref:Phage baseplate assembly protein V n=1 Tax=Janthinobacterium aestuarii TaxID=2985511 RepID=A0ABZ2GJS8_9BURK